MYCSNCGKPIPEGASYCATCGTPVVKDSVPKRSTPENNKKNNKGKIEIEYYSKDELERIIDLINSIG